MIATHQKIRGLHDLDMTKGTFLSCGSRRTLYIIDIGVEPIYDKLTFETCHKNWLFCFAGITMKIQHGVFSLRNNMQH